MTDKERRRWLTKTQIDAWRYLKKRLPPDPIRRLAKAALQLEVENRYLKHRLRELGDMENDDGNA